MKLAGTSGELPGSTGQAVLPVLPPEILPVINTNVQYRKLLVGTSGEVPGSTGRAVLPVLLPELLPDISWGFQYRNQLNGTTMYTSGATSGYEQKHPVPKPINQYYRQEIAGTTVHVSLTRKRSRPARARGDRDDGEHAHGSSWVTGTRKGRIRRAVHGDLT